MIRARARDEKTLGLEERERQLIELAVRGLPLRDILLALDERGRIEDDGIEPPARLVERAQSVEDIALQGFDRHAIRLGIPSCIVKRELRSIQTHGAARAGLERAHGPCSDVAAGIQNIGIRGRKAASLRRFAA